MSQIAYALRAEHKDTFAGATLCVGSNGESLDTAQALRGGGGVIVVPDTDVYSVAALDQHPQFERVAVPETAAPADDKAPAASTPTAPIAPAPSASSAPARGASTSNDDNKES